MPLDDLDYADVWAKCGHGCSTIRPEKNRGDVAVRQLHRWTLRRYSSSSAKASRTNRSTEPPSRPAGTVLAKKIKSP